MRLMRYMKYSISAATIVLIVLLSAATGATLNSLTSSNTSSGQLTIDAPVTYGMNQYTMLEVDDGDNDEEEVVTERLHEFMFQSINSNGVVLWDFSDGNTATGTSTNHSFSNPGRYLVTATSSSGGTVQIASVEITVEQQGNVESDNMECVCAPTAKSTVIDLKPSVGITSYDGIVTVEHDGSSESCTLRNPLQECHVRVILERTLDGAVVSQEVLFDDTFRTNEQSVEFEFNDLDMDVGEGLQLRLETDQVRDWHKPITVWNMTAPA